MYSGINTDAMTAALRDHGYNVTADDEFVQRIIAAGVEHSSVGYEQAMWRLDMDPRKFESILTSFRTHKATLAQ